MLAVITTRKDAATIRTAIGRLREIPPPIDSIVKLTPDENYLVTVWVRTYLNTYVIPDLLALLPEKERFK